MHGTGVCLRLNRFPGAGRICSLEEANPPATTGSGSGRPREHSEESHAISDRWSTMFSTRLYGVYDDAAVDAAITTAGALLLAVMREGLHTSSPHFRGCS